jgi:hypothetical protein
MFRWLSFITAVVAIALASATTACNSGGDKKDANPTPTAAAATDDDDETPDDADDDDAATATRESGDAEDDEGDDDATPRAQSTRSSGPGPALHAFESFHYAVEIGFTVDGEDGGIGVNIEGDYVSPDSHSYVQTFSFGGISGSESAVIIGEDAWSREGDGDWEESSPSLLDTDLTSADTEFFSDEEFIGDIEVLDSEDDVVDGREARRYQFSLDDLDTIVELLGEEFLEDMEGVEDLSMVVWVDKDESALLGAELTATTTAAALGDSGLDLDPDQLVTVQMTISVTDVNDGSIEIEPPV